MKQDINILYKTLNTFSKICSENQIRKAVLSPGSRSASVALSFMRNPDIEYFIINDERSAAYIGLGMAEQTGLPCILVSTTGTAALNYSPAVAEAFFKRIPLIVITTDRPNYLYNKLENQTINQLGVFEPNVLESFQIDLTNNEIQNNIEIFKSALEKSIQSSGPVQINLQIDEPFYTNEPLKDTEFQISNFKLQISNKSQTSIINNQTQNNPPPQATDGQAINYQQPTINNDQNSNDNQQITNKNQTSIINNQTQNNQPQQATDGQATNYQNSSLYTLHSSLFTLHSTVFTPNSSLQKALIISGLFNPDAETTEEIEKFIDSNHAVFVGDITSNTQAVKNKIQFVDQIVKCTDDKKALIPDIVITFGLHQLSKTLTTFLRENPPKEHWHIDPLGANPDMYFIGCKNIPLEPKDFFKHVNEINSSDFSSSYLKTWNTELKNAAKKVEEKLRTDKELAFVNQIISSAPENSIIHLGNSLTVRLAELVKEVKPSIKFFSNRGTSGIDGSMSTAIGAALAKLDEKHYLIIGDQSFVYDQNALWNNYKPANLTIFILNNKGGRIFERISGPKAQPEFEEYFVAHSPYNFELAATQYGWGYLKIERLEDWKIEKLGGLIVEMVV